MRRLAAVIAVMAVTLFARPNVQRQESKAPPPEMKILRKMIGTWQEDTVAKVAEWTPEETQAKFTTKISATLGGRFVLCRAFDRTTDKLSHITIFTYDVDEKVFRQWNFDSKGYAVESTGTWNESTKTMKLTNKRQEITSVMTVRFVDEDTFQWEVVAKDQQGKTYLDLQGKSTRQK